MARYVGLKKESTFGTAVTPDQFMRVLNDTRKFNPNNQYQRTIEGLRQLQTVQPVQSLSEGSITFNPVYDKGLGEILHMLFGSVNTSVAEASTRWTHVFTPLSQITSSTGMPSYTIGKGIDSITEARYPGCSCGRLQITANGGSLVQMVADIFGKKPTSETLETPSFSSQDYLNPGDVATQTLGGATTKFEEFSVDITGGAVPVYKPGSNEPDSIDLDPLNVTTSFTTRFLSASDLTDFLNATKKALVYQWTGPTLGNANYYLKLELPNLSFDEGDIEINEQNRTVQARNATAIEDGSGDVIKVTLENNVSSY